MDGKRWSQFDPASIAGPMPFTMRLSPWGQFMLGLLMDPTVPLGVDSNLRIDPDTGELSDALGG